MMWKYKQRGINFLLFLITRLNFFCAKCILVAVKILFVKKVFFYLKLFFNNLKLDKKNQFNYKNKMVNVKKKNYLRIFWLIQYIYE